MAERSYTYVIVGGGLAGASAVEGIRERDKNGTILLVGAESDLPYDRPPLSKQLWTGAQKLEQITLHDQNFYAENGVELRLGTEIAQIDAANQIVRDKQDNSYRYSRLLLATGGTPRRLEIPGGDLDGISYYRTLPDYRDLRGRAVDGKSALVIGGGFIGAEMAAALRMNQLEVTQVFPSQYLLSRVVPEGLGWYLTDMYRQKGVSILPEDAPASIERKGEMYLTTTRSGRQITSHLVVAGIGITPNIELAKSAGLATGDGVIVNENLQTSRPEIYAAGDIAYFPEAFLGARRIEHWDNALNQGKHAGRNMAGANEPFTYMPFFFSDMFEFGYEAVGEIDGRLETFADWQEEYKTGVVYYLKEGKLRGAMMCNLFGKVDEARALIQKGQAISPETLRGAIR